MFAVVDKFDQKINAYPQEEDLCYLCTHLDVCPLLSAVKDELVVLRSESVWICNCKCYEEDRLERVIPF